MTIVNGRKVNREGPFQGTYTHDGILYEVKGDWSEESVVGVESKPIGKQTKKVIHIPMDLYKKSKGY